MKRRTTRRKTKIRKTRTSRASARRRNPAPMRRRRYAAPKRKVTRRKNPGLLKPAQMKVVRTTAGVVIGAAGGRIVDTMLPRYVGAVPNSVLFALLTTMLLGGFLPARYRTDAFAVGVGMIAPAAIDQVYQVAAPAVAGVLPATKGKVSAIKRLPNPAPAYKARPMKSTAAARRVLGLPSVNNL